MCTAAIIHSRWPVSIQPVLPLRRVSTTVSLTAAAAAIQLLLVVEVVYSLSQLTAYIQYISTVCLSTHRHGYLALFPSACFPGRSVQGLWQRHGWGVYSMGTNSYFWTLLGSLMFEAFALTSTAISAGLC